MLNVSKEHIVRWFNSGVKINKDYLFIVSVNGKLYDVYPIFCDDSELEVKLETISSGSNKIIEVYNLDDDLDVQLSFKRCVSLPKRVLSKFAEMT